MWTYALCWQSVHAASVGRRFVQLSSRKPTYVRNIHVLWWNEFCHALLISTSTLYAYGYPVILTMMNGKFHDKGDAFNFEIVNFPHMESRMPLKPAYGVVISEVARYLNVCFSNQDYVYRSTRLIGPQVLNCHIEPHKLVGYLHYPLSCHQQQCPVKHL